MFDKGYRQSLTFCRFSFLVGKKDKNNLLCPCPSTQRVQIVRQLIRLLSRPRLVFYTDNHFGCLNDEIYTASFLRRYFPPYGDMIIHARDR